MSAWMHPALVHFAIALLFAAVVLDVVGLWRSSEKLVFAGFFNTVLGTLGALVASVTGAWASGNLGPQDPLGAALLQFHEVFAWAGTVVAVGLCGARLAMRGIIRPKLRTLYLTFALLMAALMLATGAVGGVSVYAYGVGITPEAAQRVIEARRPAEPPKPVVTAPEPAPAPAPPAPAEPVPAAAPAPAKKRGKGAK